MKYKNIIQKDGDIFDLARAYKNGEPLPTKHKHDVVKLKTIMSRFLGLQPTNTSRYRRMYFEDYSIKIGGYQTAPLYVRLDALWRKRSVLQNTKRGPDKGYKKRKM